jgi:hypothetical protein
VLPISGIVPAPESFDDPSKQDAVRASLAYMGLEPGQRLDSIPVENVFIGSCTNSRIEDMRAAAAVLKGRKKADNVRWAIVVPGSGLVKKQAEDEGLDRIFIDAGFEWREPGCSACLAMNPDKVPAGERCASTSNRNFVGRQGPGAHAPRQPGDGGGGGGDRPSHGRSRTRLTGRGMSRKASFPPVASPPRGCWCWAACRARPRWRPGAITRIRSTSSGA